MVATLKFNERNKKALKTIEFLKLLNIFDIEIITEKKLTGFEESENDKREGRINKYSSVDELFKGVLGNV